MQAPMRTHLQRKRHTVAKGTKGSANDFMRGRNGADELTSLCAVVALVLAVINIFAGQLWLTIVVVAILAYCIFRMLSLDVAARRKESDAVMKVMPALRPWLRNPQAAARENKEYKHVTCPSCKQRVRVPRGKGHIRVTCPRCHEKFEIRS